MLLQLLPLCDICVPCEGQTSAAAAQSESNKKLLKSLSLSLSLFLCVCALQHRQQPSPPSTTHHTFNIKAHLIRYSVKQLVAVAQHCQKFRFQCSDTRRALHKQFDFRSFAGKCSRRCAGRGRGRGLGVHHADYVHNSLSVFRSLQISVLLLLVVYIVFLLLLFFAIFSTHLTSNCVHRRFDFWRRLRLRRRQWLLLRLQVSIFRIWRVSVSCSSFGSWRCR